jgi:CubicO group peptidase (beta-lactamase class C family)
MRAGVFLAASQVGLMLVAAASGSAQDRAVVDREELRTRVDAIVASALAARDFQGVVAVQRHDEDPLILPYGRASVELEVPHEEDGVFAIGSVSKQFTAAAVLLLEEDGRLETSDAVARHLPGFPHGERITIEQLLTHTAGIADIFSLSSFGRCGGRYGRLDEVVADLGSAPLTHEPGSRYVYSSGGYTLLAAIIERVSGQGYGDLLRERLFLPLGLASTSHGTAGPAQARRVPGYDPWGARDLAPAEPPSDSFTTGSGSLWSSASDLLTWTRALHTGRVLSPGSYEKMTRDHGYSYGHGVSVFRRFGRRVVGHDGRISGYSSDVAHYLDDRLTVVVLGNVQSVVRDEIRVGVAAAALGEPYEPPQPRAVSEAAPTKLGTLVGRYSFGPSLVVTVVEDRGRLLARANEGAYSELVPTGDGRWFSRTLYRTVAFSVEESGKAIALLWGDGDGAPRGTRIE